MCCYDVKVVFMTDKKRFQLYLTDEEKQAIAKRAEENHFPSINSFIRWILFSKEKIEVPVKKIKRLSKRALESSSYLALRFRFNKEA